MKTSPKLEGQKLTLVFLLYVNSITNNSWKQLYKRAIYLPTIEDVYFCPARIYSTTIVNTTVVRLRVVYMGTFTPRTDSIVASFQGEIEEQ